MATIEKNIYVKCLSNIYSEIAIKANVPFSHFNPMKTLSCHSNESTQLNCNKKHYFYGG